VQKLSNQARTFYSQKGTKIKRALIVEAILVIPFLVAGIACWLFGIRYNDSVSLPSGLYLITRSRDANIASFCPEGDYGRISAIRAYRGGGSCADGAAPIMKPIAARPGDVVEVSKNGITINGKELPNTQPKKNDRHGRPLEHYPYGTYRVATDQVWVVSTYNPNSFDSRYFGPIRTSIISCRLKPLWTSGQYKLP
jgi:conjugative transfer signal peptidase TraF